MLLRKIIVSSILTFRGVEKDDSEFIDISFGWYLVETSLRKAFYQVGFAKHYGNSDLRLLPCPLGTFVNISNTSSRCINCPAGKLRYVSRIKLAYS